MTSQVRTDIPTSPIAFTRDLRRNFEIINQELSSIQTWIAQGGAYASPTFTGVMSAAAANFSGNVSIAGNLAPSSETPLLGQNVPIVANGTVTAIGNLGAGPAFALNKFANGQVTLSGFSSVTTAALPPSGELIAPAGAVANAFRPSQNIYFLISGNSVIWRVGIWADGRMTLLNMTGASPLTTVEAIYWSGTYRVL